jgi:dTDP-4-dehydrorhamnose reductase
MPIEDVLKVNAIFPRNLAKLCARHDTRLYHVTTDCVYSGDDGGYDEDSYFDAADVYGLSKNAGDAADCMVLRTSIIGEESGQSRSLLEWARSQAGKEVNGFVNHRWNGVTTVHLAEIIQAIDEQGLYSPGIFHVHSPDTLNKAELVGAISEVYGLGLRIKPVDAPTACDRSLASKHALGSRVATKPIAQQLREMRAFFEAD